MLGFLVFGRIQRKMVERDSEDLKMVNDTWNTITNSKDNPFKLPPGLEGYDAYSPLQTNGRTKRGGTVDLGIIDKYKLVHMGVIYQN